MLASPLRSSSSLRMCKSDGVSTSPDRQAFGSSPLASTWQVAEPGRTMAMVLGFALGGFFTFVFWISGVGVFAVAILIVALAASWVAAIRPWMGIDGETIVIVNPLSTKVIVLSDAVAAESGYDGLRIQLVDGSVARAWAVQKSNLMTALKRPMRSDRVVERINEAIRRHRNN